MVVISNPESTDNADAATATAPSMAAEYVWLIGEEELTELAVEFKLDIIVQFAVPTQATLPSMFDTTPIAPLFSTNACGKIAEVPPSA
jgi:hypothetical protein